MLDEEDREKKIKVNILEIVLFSRLERYQIIIVL